MSLYNLARMTTATLDTGTIILGAAVSGFLSFNGAGVPDGALVSYGIRDGANSEVGRGTYTAAGTTLSRDTVLASTNGGLKISLSGSAQVFITALAEDFITAGAGGDDTQIQYNNAGSLEGARLSYSNPGGQVNLFTGLAEGSDQGEYITVSAGNAINDGDGGAFEFNAGSAPGAGNGGYVDITAGDSDSGTSGFMTFRAGSSNTGFGGNILFQPGTGVDNTSHGKVLFVVPGSSDELELDLSQITASREMTVPDKDGTIAFLDDIVPAGDDTQIQFNNAGSLEGARLSYSYNAGEVILATGQLEGDDPGEYLTLRAGDALNDGAAGGFTLVGGEAPGAGDGGKVDIHGGDSEAGQGGELLFQAGSSSLGSGGNVSFKPGEGVDASSHGKVLFTDPETSSNLELKLSQLTTDRVITAPDADGTIALLDGNGDLAFPADTSGVILKDRNDGTNYRLYIDSGVLLIEAV